MIFHIFTIFIFQYFCRKLWKHSGFWRNLIEGVCHGITIIINMTPNQNIHAVCFAPFLVLITKVFLWHIFPKKKRNVFLFRYGLNDICNNDYTMRTMHTYISQAILHYQIWYCTARHSDKDSVNWYVLILKIWYLLWIKDSWSNSINQ